MKTNLELMRAAKGSLRENWLMAAVATLVYTVISGIVNIITGGPMNMGYVSYLREVKNGGEVQFESLLSGFNDFVRTLVAYLVSIVIVYVGIVLLIVPGIVAAIGLSMTFFILAEDKQIDPIAALQKSWNMMRGHKWTYFCLFWRFIGWWLLVPVTLGIAFFWVWPYFQLAAMNLYDEIKGHNHASFGTSGTSDALRTSGARTGKEGGYLHKND